MEFFRFRRGSGRWMFSNTEELEINRHKLHDLHMDNPFNDWSYFMNHVIVEVKSCL